MASLEAVRARTRHAAEKVVQVSSEAKHLVPILHHDLCQVGHLLKDPGRHATALVTAATVTVVGLVRRKNGATEGPILRKNCHHDLHSLQRLSLLGQGETGDNGGTVGMGEGPAEGGDAEDLHVVPNEGHASSPGLPVNLVQEVGTI